MYNMTTNVKKKKIVALLSGGLDSQLAVKMMQKQGFEVSAVAIKTPFCDFDCGRGCGFEIRERSEELGVDLKTVYLGDEYIKMLKTPKHGRGAGYNPCIDCHSMMFDAAKKHMEEIGAEFIISGEVLGQRPMSQHGQALGVIEKESELKDKIRLITIRRWLTRARIECYTLQFHSTLNLENVLKGCLYI